MNFSTYLYREPFFLFCPSEDITNFYKANIKVMYRMCASTKTKWRPNPWNFTRINWQKMWTFFSKILRKKKPINIQKHQWMPKFKIHIRRYEKIKIQYITKHPSTIFFSWKKFCSFFSYYWLLGKQSTDENKLKCANLQWKKQICMFLKKNLKKIVDKTEKNI